MIAVFSSMGINRRWIVIETFFMISQGCDRPRNCYKGLTTEVQNGYTPKQLARFSKG